MLQGRQAIFDLTEGKVSWPPVVVPFGLDPFGWHGEHETYSEVCDYALEKCTLLPKVYPFRDPLFIGKGRVKIASESEVNTDCTIKKQYTLTGGKRDITMVEVQTPGDSSWKALKRWIENDDDLEYFLSLDDLPPSEPDIEAVREKECQVGKYGLPYIETPDPFYLVSEMFPTDTFFIKTAIDVEPVLKLIELTKQRILHSIESLCRNAGCPFILRLIGAEMAAPPFMSRESFMRFEGDFYRETAEITRKYGILSSFHCHGPTREIMDYIWELGYSFIEPFEPSPRGNVTIAEAIAAADGRGIVFGGFDDVLFVFGTPDEVREGVKRCLDDARDTGLPYILSQTSTPFYEPLEVSVKKNMLLFMELGTKG